MTTTNTITTESLQNVSTETIAAVLAELQRASEGCDVGDAVERILGGGGVSLAASNAARRAYQRNPDMASLIDHLAKYFTSEVQLVAGERAGAFIGDLRSGRLDLSDDVVREQMIDLLDAMAAYAEGSDGALCQVAKLACFALVSAPHHRESTFADLVGDVVEHLEDEEARAFVVELERLAAEPSS